MLEKEIINRATKIIGAKNVKLVDFDKKTKLLTVVTRPSFSDLSKTQKKRFEKLCKIANIEKSQWIPEMYVLSSIKSHSLKYEIWHTHEDKCFVSIKPLFQSTKTGEFDTGAAALSAARDILGWLKLEIEVLQNVLKCELSNYSPKTIRLN